MDLLIAGVARAGTTLIANMLTTPPSRWVLVEPGITLAGMGEHVRQMAERFGWRFDEAEWYQNETPRERFDRLLLPRLSQIEKWGVKEVNLAGLPELLEVYPPRRIVLAVRDIRDCAVSMKEKETKQGPLAGQVLAPKSDDWLHRRLIDSAHTLVSLLQSHPRDTLRVVRYEDFVSSADERESLAHWLDWPLAGDPGSNLDLFGRSYETERHPSGVGTTSAGRWRDEPSPELRAFAESVVADAVSYQRAFNYEVG
jgi:hypothetical protein